MAIRTELLNIDEINIRDLFSDETIFVLHPVECNVPYSKGSRKEYRCSCRPLMNMTAKSIQAIFENKDQYAIMRISHE